MFYHITLILQYCWDKTIARSGKIHKDNSGILNFVIKCFGITNTSVQNFAVRIFAQTKSFMNKFNKHISSLLMSLLRAIVICQKYFRTSVISSTILLFAPSLVMRRCTV